METGKNKNKAKGGFARARMLSPDQRSEIAKKAAQARHNPDIPKVDYSGTLTIAGNEIPCAVIERDGRTIRVIVQREVVGLLTGNKKGGLDRYLKAQNIQDYIPQKFANTSLDQATITLKIRGKRAFCYEGEDIVDLCKMYLEARKIPKLLLPNQMQLADRAEVIVTALAKVGITGLIDEATGYQAVRAKDALEAYLNSVLLKELGAWVKRFPDEFFKEMFRLNNWTWTGTNKRPALAGKYIKDVIYSRLGPGILEQLETRNPITPSGRKTTHHQWLTEDVGHPALAQHLHAVIALMRINGTWKEFKFMLDRAFPKRSDKQLGLPI